MIVSEGEDRQKENIQEYIKEMGIAIWRRSQDRMQDQIF